MWPQVWINSRTRSKSWSIAPNWSRRWFWTEKSSAPWPRGSTPRLPTLACWLHGCLRDSEGLEKRGLKDDQVCSTPPFTSSPTKGWNLSGPPKYLVSLPVDLGKKGFRCLGTKRHRASKPMSGSRSASSSSLWWTMTECTWIRKDIQPKVTAMATRIMFTIRVR